MTRPLYRRRKLYAVSDVAAGQVERGESSRKGLDGRTKDYDP